MANLTSFTQSFVAVSTPLGIGKTTDVAGFFKGVLSNQAQLMTQAYGEKLREHALNAGWPEEMVAKIGISYDQDSHKIVYDTLSEKEVLDLEYGTQDINPMPALRTFMFGSL